MSLSLMNPNKGKEEFHTISFHKCFITESESIFKLMAKAKLLELDKLKDQSKIKEAIEISKKYAVLCRHTAFIASELTRQ